VKFALFYEIPVARPWTKDKEHQAFKNVLEQAVLGDADDRPDGPPRAAGVRGLAVVQGRRAASPREASPRGRRAES